MAKTIKFNLICDGKPVRTLDDLQNNFSIEDVITYFNNKLLQRWLSVRGYDEELEKVEKLQGLDTLDLVKELIKIFEIETDLISMEENIYILRYKEEKGILLDGYKKLNFKLSTIIDDYHAGYMKLVDTIVGNKNDITKIKAAVKEIDANYNSLYEMDYRNLFYTFLNNAPMAVFVMLMNDNMRKKYLPQITANEDGAVLKDTDKNSDEEEMYRLMLMNDNMRKKYLPQITINEDGTVLKDTDENSDKKEMYRLICNLLSTNDKLMEMLGDNLKFFAGVTDGYWKDVETKEKKYMILKMERGNFIRSAGESGGDLGSADINDNFIILDGIDYKSNNANHKLLYMEV
ncbi:hypothetical protein [Bacillus sp. Hm123]|uniref:hypothetical protein n=1 Tax=Bacillus sp. Hm123 TaxID=3450745 RepID=UPI003F41E0B7